MGSNKGLRSVIICVLVLGLVLEQVQVEGMICCKDTMAKSCYLLCHDTLGKEEQYCLDACVCKIVSDEDWWCPPDYPKETELHCHSDSDTPNAIEFCNVGCRSSVCDSINNGYCGNEKKIDVELCGSACASFCNKIAATVSVSA